EPQEVRPRAAVQNARDPAREPAPERQPRHEQRQDDGDEGGRDTETRHGEPKPDHLVDETAVARQEEEGKIPARAREDGSLAVRRGGAVDSNPARPSFHRSRAFRTALKSSGRGASKLSRAPVRGCRKDSLQAWRPSRLKSFRARLRRGSWTPR